MTSNCKKFIDLFLPVTTCNLRCKYCYIAQLNLFEAALPKFNYTPEQIVKAFSVERLGGVCVFNICGGGETMLPSEIVPITRGLLEQGHYVMIVTNGTISKRFDEFIQLPKELLKRLLFKFSFQFLELKRLDLMDKFFENIKKVKNAGCSFSLEIGASDDFVPYIEEIKQISIDNVGALPHVTILRDDRIKNRPILTKYSLEEYKKIWDQFDSEMFTLRMKYWGEKRNEFCYAGLYSACVNLENGETRACHTAPVFTNVFENLDTPIKFSPIAFDCPCDHCWVSHAWLTMGDIPELDAPTFYHMRDRVAKDGSHWLSEDYINFLDIKLSKTNGLLSKKEINKFMNRKAKCKIRILLKNIFSITNSSDKSHKIFRFLGLKISFKRK